MEEGLTKTVIPRVTCTFSGRTGNNVLQAYRAFWFARVHGLPLESVVFRENAALSKSPLFGNIRDSFIPAVDYDALRFGKVCDLGLCSLSVPEMRRTLCDVSLADSENCRITGSNFLYPELPWERALFVRLFDNIAFRSLVVEKYKELLSGSTVGYTVRRTDALRHACLLKLSPDDIRHDLHEIISRYGGFVTVLVTSDDPAFVHDVIEGDTLLERRVRVIVDGVETTIYLLSLCDAVVCNGQLQCATAYTGERRDAFVFASTFGQIAQLLNRSYKYLHANTPLVALDAETARGGCRFDYPDPQKGAESA